MFLAPVEICLCFKAVPDDFNNKKLSVIIIDRNDVKIKQKITLKLFLRCEKSSGIGPDIYIIHMHMFACVKTLPDFNLDQFKIIFLGSDSFQRSYF